MAAGNPSERIQLVDVMFSTPDCCCMMPVKVRGMGTSLLANRGLVMTDFRFLHAADIHLDSPLRGLSRYEGLPEDDIRGATRAAFDNLVQRAHLLMGVGDCGRLMSAIGSSTASALRQHLGGKQTLASVPGDV